MNLFKTFLFLFIFTASIYAQNKQVNIFIRNNASEVIKHGVKTLQKSLAKLNTPSELFIRKDYPKVAGTSIYIGNIAN